MTRPEPRSAPAFGWWLTTGIAAAVAMGLFSATRTKPLVVFAAGLGIGLGVLLRILADWLLVGRTRRVMLSAALLSAAAFGLSFGLGYRRAVVEWEQIQSSGPDHPLAAALLKRFPEVEVSGVMKLQQRFTLSDYLARRLPSWPSPWPEVLWGAEWILCLLLGGGCVGFGKRSSGSAVGK